MIKPLTTIEFMRNNHQMSGDPESTVFKEPNSNPNTLGEEQHLVASYLCF